MCLLHGSDMIEIEIEAEEEDELLKRGPSMQLSKKGTSPPNLDQAVLAKWFLAKDFHPGH